MEFRCSLCIPDINSSDIWLTNIFFLFHGLPFHVVKCPLTHDLILISSTFFFFWLLLPVFWYHIEEITVKFSIKKLSSCFFPRVILLFWLLCLGL